MDLNQKYAINEEKISWRLVGDRVMILDLDSGFTYSLNATGRRVWKGIDKGRSVGDILASLAAAYPLPKNRLQKDLARLLASLQKAKLVSSVERH